ncbi:MAG: deaminase/reductase [Gemmatimonadetes bacterium]|nr:deaminase/reductase [Gemmatimonadota bacterium]
MAEVRVSCFGISLDGYGAGADQSLENPLGVKAMDMMGWFFPTHAFQSMHGGGEGETGVDNDVAQAGATGNGAWIMGRNMFGPIRGPWPDENWKGWWGDDPPYHVPTFVLTHHARDPIQMAGGTEFRFVTGGIHAALEQARDAAGDKQIRIGGGVSTVRQYLQAQLVDELHLALSPVLLGKGEHIFHGLDLRELGYGVDRQVQGERALHLFIRKR